MKKLSALLAGVVVLSFPATDTAAQVTYDEQRSRSRS